MRSDDQGLSFAFCCGSAGGELPSFTLLVQCQILKGTLELNISPIYFPNAVYTSNRGTVMMSSKVHEKCVEVDVFQPGH